MEPMIPSAQPQLPTETPDPQAKDETKTRLTEWKARVDACKAYRRKLIPNWVTSIDYRRGKPFASQTDEDRIVVNLDWSLTKSKQASLFSQVPQLRLSHPPQSTQEPWVHSFEQRVNDTIINSGIESALDEELPDVINAAGIGAIMVAYEAITQDKQIPSIDLSSIPPELQAQMLQTGLLPNGEPIPMETVPEVIDKRYTINRISPADLLWPISFSGSDFDLAPWIGRSGRITWAEAVKRFNLTEEEKVSILSDERNPMDKLTRDVDKDKVAADEMVSFDELFYHEHQYDLGARSYQSIHHLVFVTGREKPVIDEPWKGQQENEQKQLLGALRFPIRTLTLTYITDETIPPSDSAIGRPQVNEINKLRTQNMLQRQRSLPIRWMDINRVDPTIQYALMRGNWQSIIPVQGQGDKIIGEVARAGMPPEHGVFEAMAKSDLAEAWSLGPNQTGTGTGVETKGEGNIIESNYQTRISRERAIVGKHFCTIGEVVAGLMCLYEDPSTFGEGFDPIVCKTLSYSILADSTVLLDSNQKLKRLIDFVNFTAKSGWVNLEPVLKEIASLSGLDPNTVIQAPQPKPPTEPSVSIRFTGVEDLTNPLVLAVLLGHGQPPTPELIEKAKQLIAMTVVPSAPPIQQPPTIEKSESSGEGKSDKSVKITPTPVEEKDEKGPILRNMEVSLLPSPAPPPSPTPNSAPPPIGEANPDYEAMPRINKRTVER